MAFIFITKGKTNWKYLVIVFILGVIVGVGSLWLSSKQKVFPVGFPEIKKVGKVIKEINLTESSTLPGIFVSYLMNRDLDQVKIKRVEGIGGGNSKNFCGQISLQNFKKIEDIVLNNLDWGLEGNYSDYPGACKNCIKMHLVISINGVTKEAFFNEEDLNNPVINLPSPLKQVTEEILTVGNSIKENCQ